MNCDLYDWFEFSDEEMFKKILLMRYVSITSHQQKKKLPGLFTKIYTTSGLSNASYKKS